MIGTTDLALFIAASLLLAITPGPDTFYILGRTTLLGWRGGAVAALGISAGLCVHTVAAALGLSALLAASATAFTALKWLGAAYLVYIGIALLLTRPATPQSPPSLPAVRLRTVFAQGFLTNVLNPKVALFFLAFLPHFVDPAAPAKTLAFLFLGVVFNVVGTLWNLFVAWSAARVRGIARSGRFSLWVSRTVGAMLVYFGIALATRAET